MSAGRLVLDRFAWIEGHADLWAVFRDATAFRLVVTALAEQYRSEAIAAVCGDRVVLVDDWIETGSQVRAAAQMIREGGAELIGCSVIVDDMSEVLRSKMCRVSSLLRADELPGQGT